MPSSVRSTGAPIRLRAIVLGSVVALSGCISTSEPEDGGGGGGDKPQPEPAGAVRLSSDSYAVAEDGGAVAVTVDRVNGSSGVLAVDYATVQLAPDDPQRAVAGEDFEPTSGTLRFGDGEMQRTFTVAVADDGADNTDLLFEVELTNATTAATAPTQAEVRIVDDDDGGGAPEPGRLELSAAGYTVGESGGAVTISVERVDGTDGTVAVDYATQELADDPSHAVAGEDYAASSGRLTFDDGEAQRAFTVPIVDDDRDNTDLAFRVALSDASTATGTPTQAQVTITDDDPAPSPGSLRLSATDYTVGENGGSVTVTVERVDGSDGSVGVDYSTRELGTDPAHAVAGQDYAATSGRLSLGDGVTQEQFTVAIADDGQDNPDLAFEVVLSNASSSTTSPTEATVTIVDDDPVETSAVTLNWTAPTTREDGTALSLSQIGGYVIYSGTDPGALTEAARIGDSSATSHTISGLVPGTYYFTVSAYDVDELEGPQSAAVSATVP